MHGCQCKALVMLRVACGFGLPAGGAFVTSGWLPLSVIQHGVETSKPKPVKQLQWL